MAVFNISEGEHAMQSTITRRAALTGTAAGAAAIVAGTGTALANDDRDRAEWLDLFWRYLQERADQDAAIAARERAEETAGAETPCPPRHLCSINRDGTVLRDVWGYPWCKSEDDIRASLVWQLEHSDPDLARRGAEALQSDLAARSKWVAEREAVRERNNLKPLGAAEDGFDHRVDVLANEIAHKPATSMVGVAVKLAIWKMEDDVADTVLDADWVHMTALGALHDAIREAGLHEEIGRLTRERLGLQHS